VKVIDAGQVHSAARLRFVHETHVLSALSGTGLTGLYDAGQDDDHLFLVQRYVPGRTLEELLAEGPLDLVSTLHLGVQVAGALEVAHAAGVFHRDVKPANVIVGEVDTLGSAAPAVTLIDFGFARSPVLDASIRNDLVGTVRYLAPEAAGLLATAADERSDLYSLGVVLYECLAGEPPYPGPTVGDLLRQHLSTTVPSLRANKVAVPGAVDAVIQRLLRKEPTERYQSAGALAGDLTELLAAVERGDANPRLVIGRFDQRRTITDPAFVGREVELEALTALVNGLHTADGGLLLLEADSGGGKSRLLAEVTQQAGASGVTVLQGQGVAQAGQRPFGVLHDVAADIVAAVGQDDSDDSARLRLRAALGDAATTVVRALPALAQLLDVRSVEMDGPGGPEQFGEQRSLAALRILLTALPTAEQPVLLVLDDCQWADPLTIRLLAGLFDGGASPSHLGVVAAFRSEEVAADHPLRAIATASVLSLGPLPDAAMTMLAESMAGPLPAETLETVVRLADGSPFMGASVLRGLVEAGALLGTPTGWVVQPAAFQRAQAARQSAAFLVQRLELLPPAAIELLSVGAVLGKAFDLDTAVALAGSPADAPAVIEDARRRRLLWVDDRTGRCSFFHDKIREALLARLDADVRRDLHARAADGLAAQPDASPFDLAYHYDAAGRPDDALPHALLGAQLARTQQALDNAVLHYRMAARAATTADLPTRLRIAEGLGDVLTLQGRYVEAEQQLSLARSLVQDRTHAAELEGKLGDLAFKQGDIPTAKLHLEGAVAKLGRPVPRWTVVLFLRLVWELLVQTTHTLLPKWTTGRRDAEGPDAAVDFLTMRLSSRLAYLYWFHSGKVPCAWVHLRGMNLAERYPPSAELGQAWSEHAPVMTMLPWYSRGISYAHKSLAVRRQLDDVWGQGQSLGFAGVVLYSAGRYADAQAACEGAISYLERSGDQWEVNTAGWNRALALYRQGQLTAAADAAAVVHAAALEIGDQASAGISLSIWARSRSGDVDAALIDAQLSKGTEDAHTGCEVHLAAALRALHDDRLEDADEQLRAARALVRRAGLRQEYVAPIYPWHATTLRRLAESTPAHNPGLRGARLRRAAATNRLARAWAVSYRNNLPHTLREAGLIASLRGRGRSADRLLHKSLRLAEQQGATYEAALTRLAIAELAVAAGAEQATYDEAFVAVRELDTAPEQIGVDVDSRSMSLFDRFTTLLKVGRAITAATSLSAVDEGVREAALTLLRGERCHLIPVSRLTDEALTTQSGEAVDEVSRSLLLAAVSSGGPVVMGDLSTSDSDSLLLAGLKSVLAAPISAHGQPVSCFYVTHRQIGQLFGDEETQLAAFISTLAGAAFEHLAGSETRFRSLAQNSSDVITLVGADGLVIYQSAAAAQVFGNTGSVVGLAVCDWAHPDDLAAFEEALGGARSREGVRIECRLRHADGTYRDVETAISNLLEEPTVAALVLNSRDVTERRRLEDELRERALHDALTGLPNRVLFMDRARHAMDQSMRTSSSVCVAFLDLDDFKAVNDTFGHAVGDELLSIIAERITTCVRPSDTVTRLGGDEFAVLLENTDLPTAVGVVERILAAVSVPIHLAGTMILTRASIGLTCTEGHYTEPDQLLAHADTAMYAAKARGLHGYELFAPEMQAATEKRLALRNEIDLALSRSEFRLHYQQIIDAYTGLPMGMEALIRWEHPQRGLLAPALFIDFAEDSGQVVEMGRWALVTACIDAVGLGRAGHISVNVSARQLQDSRLVGDVEAALSESGIEPGRLILEITETAAMTDTEGTIGRLHELKALGVRLALDDFGTGYSPLSYLRRFPVDLLKIDQFFVRHITTSLADRAIVKGVVDMAHALGLRAVAEGVETQEQYAVLSELGCDLGQGYLWMRPESLADLTARVALAGPGEPAPTVG